MQGGIVNITLHSGSAGRNYQEVPLHPGQHGPHTNRKQKKCCWDTDELQPSYNVDGNTKWYDCCGRLYGGTSKNYKGN